MKVYISEPHFQPFTLTIEINTKDEAEQLVAMVGEAKATTISSTVWAVLNSELKARGVRK